MAGIRLRWVQVGLLASSFIASFIFSSIYLTFAGMPATGIRPAVSGSVPTIVSVEPGSPASIAGLKIGDVIEQFNGRGVGNLPEYLLQEQLLYPGNPVPVTVNRSGNRVSVTLPEFQTTFKSLKLLNQVAVAFWVLVGILELAFALMLALGRNRERSALLAALFLAVLTTMNSQSAGISSAFRNLPLFLRAWMYPAQLASFEILFFAFAFCANFPKPIFTKARSWFLLSLPVAALYAFLFVLNFNLDFGADPSSIFKTGVGRYFNTLQVPIVGILALYGAGAVIAILVNYQRCDRLNRRRMRLAMAGALIGLAGVLPAAIIHELVSYDLVLRSGELAILFGVLRLIFLASFVYAVVKYRVFDIPVLLKRSGRYLLVQRGFIFVLFIFGISAMVAFARGMSHAAPQQAQLAVPLGAVLGIALVWAGTIAHKRVSKRLDRAFFRSAYDARLVLEEMGAKSRAATHRSALAAILRTHIRQALHPSFMCIYLQRAGAFLELENGARHHGPEKLPLDLPMLTRLAQSSRATELQPADWAASEMGELAEMQPECLVPIVGRQQRLQGVLVMGPKMSEEPYSGEDLRLLNLAASQAGVALENISLAEDIATKMRAEQLAAHELEIARSVQSRLLPEVQPALTTLEYAGRCTQARQIGGDYYDFIQYAPGKVGFVLADISGKGISAALLMSNLQASLRSHQLGSPSEIESTLIRVNDLFQKSISMGTFATLFLGFYDDATQTLTYANCGHAPPIVLRSDGSLERLDPTATVVGAFTEWSCEIAEVKLHPLDMLMIYSDGIPEAMNEKNEMFGEERLLQLVKDSGTLAPQEILGRVEQELKKFTGSQEQSDDITVVIARSRATSASARA